MSKSWSAIFLSLFLSVSARAEGSRFDTFQRLAETHGQEIHHEGFAYMVGGSLGLGLSVGLGIASSEALPKIGYSLIQVLSAAAISHGASLYLYGDGFTKKATELRELATQLEAQKLPPEVRRKILDDATATSVRAEVERYKRLRTIRGYLEVASTVTSATTIYFSKTKGSSSNAALGFIALISAVGAYADLTSKGGPDSFEELYAYDIIPERDRITVGMSLRF